jgi:hypothetical protein
MATIDDLIAQIEVDLEMEQKREKKTLAEAKVIIEKAQVDSRGLTDEEEERVATLFKARDDSRDNIVGIKKKLANTIKIKDEDLKADAEAREVVSSGSEKSSRVSRVKVCRV